MPADQTMPGLETRFAALAAELERAAADLRDGREVPDLARLDQEGQRWPRRSGSRRRGSAWKRAPCKSSGAPAIG